jgi:SPOR domain
MRACLLLLILSIFSPALCAASQFWVCVATAEDADGAQRVVSEAASALHQPLLVRSVETSDGVRQRIVAGPYSTHAAALAFQQRAQQSGYADSWVYASETGSSVDATGPNTPKYSDELPPVEDYQSDVFQSPAVRAAIESGKLPTEIPPGYQLNKLFRDGTVPTPQTPP